MILCAAIISTSFLPGSGGQPDELPGLTDSQQDETQLIVDSRDEAADVQLPDATDASLSDNETEMVLGIRVRKDRNCTVELNDYVTPDGEMFSAYTCTPQEPAAPHPYAALDNATLSGMSYADAEAAAFLGKRLIQSDTKKSYQLLIRASALEGGRTDHLAWLSSQAYGASSINGVPQVLNIKRQYELAALASLLGDGPQLSEFLKDELLRIGVSSQELGALDMRARYLFEYMRRIQRQVLGEINMGVSDDA